MIPLFFFSVFFLIFTGCKFPITTTTWLPLLHNYLLHTQIRTYVCNIRTNATGTYDLTRRSHAIETARGVRDPHSSRHPHWNGPGYFSPPHSTIAGLVTDRLHQLFLRYPST